MRSLSDSTANMSDKDVKVLAEKYQALRNDKGSDSDELYKVMKELGERLGSHDTPGAEVLSTLGKPDKLRPSIDSDKVSVQTMPGPAIPSSTTTSFDDQKSYYLVYNFEPKKQYLFFKIDSITEKVVTSGWQELE
ncbi:hypothetical protein [Parasitella parasitica]|uniref:Uncharacterized protein n=1 Tax=Parasitella parasitica TaxID=35722 RepID=A0A0B7NMR3_9FUNG|nr:hypothetical protein [Parasitella parasitica]